MSKLAKVKVALQLPSGARVQAGDFACDASLWDVLLAADAAAGGTLLMKEDTAGKWALPVVFLPPSAARRPAAGSGAAQNNSVQTLQEVSEHLRSLRTRA